MKSFYFIAFSAIFLLVSCKKKEHHSANRTEVLEIFEAVTTATSANIGDLKYFESSEYNQNQKKSTTYYDNLGKVKGKEVFSYLSETDTLPIQSSYFDGNNTLLSYYKFVNDLSGRLISAYAFDAATNELLRIEQFTYKPGQNIKNSKRIFNSDYKPDRRYAFSYDEYNNETGFQVYNSVDSLSVNEEYKIVKRDSTNRWLEKWGFANGKPVTIHKRSLK